jgi:hypothetical protein
MDSECTFKFTIRRQHHDEELHVRANRVLAGSAAHCEVRLDESEAAPEQLLFETVNQVIIVHARSRAHRVLVDGSPFNEGPIQASSVIELGSTRITAELITLTSSSSGRRGWRGRRLGIYLLGAVGFPFGVYIMLGDPSGAASAPPSVDPPRLIADAPTSCPQSNAEEARAAADNEQLLAQGMRERAPFYAEDGVRAIPHFRRAAACYGVAGDSASSRAALTDAQNLEQRINREFHVHRARLDYALSTAQYDKALSEVHLLSSYLGDQPSEFKTRLKWIDQQIQLKHMDKQGAER